MIPTFRSTSQASIPGTVWTGHISVVTRADGPMTNVKITKSGGTDYLFTSIPIWVGSSEDDVKLKFDVYCEMGASSGSEPMVKLHDCDSLTWDESKDEDYIRENVHYTERELTLNREVLGHNNGMVFLKGSPELGYPHSNCGLYVYDRSR